MAYSILSGTEFCSGDYAISSIQASDAIKIMNWRNDQIDALRQTKPLTEEEQNKYFEEKVFKEYENRKPNPLLVRFTQKESLIGYGGLVHLEWEKEKAEVSFLLETERSADGELYLFEMKIFMLLIKRLAFDHLQLNELTTEAYAHRKLHVDGLESCGFSRIGVIPKRIKIEERWVDAVLGACKRSDYLEEQGNR